MSEGNTSLSDLINAGGKTRNIANIIVSKANTNRIKNNPTFCLLSYIQVNSIRGCNG
jgi:hypothetical protein